MNKKKIIGISITLLLIMITITKISQSTQETIDGTLMNCNDNPDNPNYECCEPINNTEPSATQYIQNTNTAIKSYECGEIDVTLIDYTTMKSAGIYAYASITGPTQSAMEFVSYKDTFNNLPPGTYTITVFYDNNIFNDAKTQTETITPEDAQC
jgi:hypothetical protein